MLKLITNGPSVKSSIFVLQLFLWPLEETADVEVDGETLDDALYRINEDIDSLTHLTNFPQGYISLCSQSFALFSFFKS